jgi:hypothetical protein
MRRSSMAGRPTLSGTARVGSSETFLQPSRLRYCLRSSDGALTQERNPLLGLPAEKRADGSFRETSAVSERS